MRAHTLGVVLLLAAFGATAQPSPIKPEIPQGWEYLRGNGPDRLPNGNCEAGVDEQLQSSGMPNMTVRCDRPVGVFGGIGQIFLADSYRGKRVRFSGLLKADIQDVNATDAALARSPSGVDYSRVRDEPRTANARGIGGLWVRVLGASPAESLVADGMENRPIRGVVEWMPAEIVVDVPNDATGVWIGFWMQGRGQIWASRLQLTEVPKSVPVTAEPAPPTGPRNLSLQ